MCVSLIFLIVVTCADDVQSSDDEDEMMGENLLARRRLHTTHEAKVRDALEEEDEELFSGVRALSIRGSTPETKEILENIS